MLKFGSRAASGGDGGHDFNLKAGLDLPILGEPEQRVEDGSEVGACALIGPDYIGLKPKMLVAVGDQVKQGQALFAHKPFDSVVFTARSRWPVP